MNGQTISPEGKKKLEAELLELINKRPKIVARIQAAQEHGDLRENADYHDAREEQGFTESRIKEIEGILKDANVADMTSLGYVQIGSKVVLQSPGKKEVLFAIAGSHEGNPAAGLLSCDSPLGLALLDKKVGEQVTVETPAGLIVYEIKKID